MPLLTGQRVNSRFRGADGVFYAVFMLAILSTGMGDTSLSQAELWPQEDRFYEAFEDCLLYPVTAQTIGCGSTSLRQRSAKCYLVAEDGANKTTMEPEPRALRMVSPDVLFAQQLVNASLTFTSAAGLPPVNWTLPSPLEIASVLGADLEGPRVHHAYVLPSSGIGDVVSKFGMAQDLSQLVAQDSLLDWAGLLPLYRDVLSVYDGKVRAIPAQGMMMQLYYRRDLMGDTGRPPPRTWAEVVAYAAKFNGTDLNGDGIPDYGICMWNEACDGVSAALVAILASLVQSKGRNSGLFFEPESLRCVAGTDAWDAALEIARNLTLLAAPVAADPPSSNTPCFSQPLFSTGRCAMTLSVAGQFKSDSSPTNPLSVVRGKVGSTILPGSERVLDWQSNKLVPCTEELCPYATRHSPLPASTFGSGLSQQAQAAVDMATTATSNGTATIWVNRAPYIMAGGQSVFISQLQSMPQRLATYDMVVQMVRDAGNWPLVAAPGSEFGPTRQEHLDDTGRWAVYGYNPDDLDSFLEASRTSLSSANVAMDLRCEGAFTVKSLMISAARLAANTDIPLAVVAASTRQLFAQELTDDFMTRLRATYKASISFRTTSDPVAATSSTASHSSSSRVTWISVAVVVGVGGVALTVTVALVFWHVRNRNRLQHSGGRITAPGVGRATTICITDIESSTRLWETLPETVMSRAVQLHHECIRRCAAAHNGYESAWEGDSFILSFRGPQEALLFCMDVQDKLLHLPWPEVLLKVDICRPLYLTDASAEGEAVQRSAPGSASMRRTLGPGPDTGSRPGFLDTASPQTPTAVGMPQDNTNLKTPPKSFSAAVTRSAALAFATRMAQIGGSVRSGSIGGAGGSGGTGRSSLIEVGAMRFALSPPPALAPAPDPVEVSGRGGGAPLRVRMLVQTAESMGRSRAGRPSDAPGGACAPSVLSQPLTAPGQDEPGPVAEGGITACMYDAEDMALESYNSVASTHLPLSRPPSGCADSMNSLLGPVATACGEPSFGAIGRQPGPQLRRSKSQGQARTRPARRGSAINVLMASVRYGIMSALSQTGSERGNQEVQSQSYSTSAPQVPDVPLTSTVRALYGGGFCFVASRPRLQVCDSYPSSDSDSDSDSGGGAAAGGAAEHTRGVTREARTRPTKLPEPAEAHTDAAPGLPGAETQAQIDEAFPHVMESPTAAAAAGAAAGDDTGAGTSRPGSAAPTRAVRFAVAGSSCGADNPEDRAVGTGSALRKAVGFKRFADISYLVSSFGMQGPHIGLRPNGATGAGTRGSGFASFGLGAPRDSSGHQVLLRGLRVRIGCHSGVHAATDVSYNRSMARVIYSGLPMTKARAVVAAAQGGMVVISGATHALLTGDADPANVPYLTLQGKSTGSGSSPGCSILFWHAGVHNMDDLLSQPLELYMASTPMLAPRWALLAEPGPSDTCRTVARCVAAAPVGDVCLAAMTVTGGAAIAAWNLGVWRECTAMLWREAAALCGQEGGFLATTRARAGAVSSRQRRRDATYGGAPQLVAAFSNSVAAIRWSASLISWGLLASWPSALLLHELAEEQLWLSNMAYPRDALDIDDGASVPLSTVTAAASGTVGPVSVAAPASRLSRPPPVVPTGESGPSRAMPRAIDVRAQATLGPPEGPRTGPPGPSRLSSTSGINQGADQLTAAAQSGCLGPSDGDQSWLSVGMSRSRNGTCPKMNAGRRSVTGAATGPDAGLQRTSSLPASRGCERVICLDSTAGPDSAARRRTSGSAALTPTANPFVGNPGSLVLQPGGSIHAVPVCRGALPPLTSFMPAGGLPSHTGGAAGPLLENLTCSYTVSTSVGFNLPMRVPVRDVPRLPGHDARLPPPSDFSSAAYGAGTPRAPDSMWAGFLMHDGFQACKPAPPAEVLQEAACVLSDLQCGGDYPDLARPAASPFALGVAGTGADLEANPEPDGDGFVQPADTAVAADGTAATPVTNTHQRRSQSLATSAAATDSMPRLIGTAVRPAAMLLSPRSFAPGAAPLPQLTASQAVKILAERHQSPSTSVEDPEVVPQSEKVPRAGPSLPGNLLDHIISRGLRLRAGVAQGSAAVEVHCLTGEARYTGPASALALALAERALVSHVVVSSVAMRQAAGASQFAGLHPSVAARVRIDRDC